MKTGSADKPKGSRSEREPMKEVYNELWNRKELTMIKRVIGKRTGGKPVSVKERGTIRLSVCSKGGGVRHELKIIFSKKDINKITKSGYVSLGRDDIYEEADDRGYVEHYGYIEGNIYYFLDDNEYGYKVTLQDNVNTAYLRLTIDNPDYWKQFVGLYRLHRDKNNNLYYFDLSEPLRS